MRFPDVIEAAGFPISLVFSKNGRAFFSERLTGNIWEVLGEEDFELIHKSQVVNVTGHHETGLLGIELDPDFENSNLIFCYQTYGPDIERAKNKIFALNIADNSEKLLLDDIPAHRIHNGGILKVGPDNCLYAGVGVDNGVKEKSQDINYLGGKILRLNLDGSIPNDNPFPNSPVYSYGHRNIFGLAFHPNGSLYISEPGPEENDEINLVEKGKNYGWPRVTGVTHDSKFVDPIITYTPTITPTQCCFLGEYFYFGSYNEGTVHKLTLDKNDSKKVLADNIVYRGKSFGMIGVFVSTEGKFYVATPTKIMNFEPMEK